MKRVDATTVEVVNKKGRKDTTRQRNVVSAEGKMRTVTRTSVDGSGRKVNMVVVFEKH